LLMQFDELSAFFLVIESPSCAQQNVVCGIKPSDFEVATVMVAAHGSGDTGFNLIQHQTTFLCGGGILRGSAPLGKLKGRGQYRAVRAFNRVSYAPATLFSWGLFFAYCSSAISLSSVLPMRSMVGLIHSLCSSRIAFEMSSFSVSSSCLSYSSPSGSFTS